MTIIRRFSLYHELGTRIKSVLNSNRKGSPLVRIDMPFDSIEFDGGLQRLAQRSNLLRVCSAILYQVTKI